MKETKKASGPLFDGFGAVSFESWKEKVIQDLKGKPYEKLIWQTPEGFEVQPYYTAEQTAALDYLKSFQNQIIDTEHTAEGTRYWVNNETIAVNDEKAAAKEALNALNAGADGIVFDLSAKANPDCKALLEQIKMNYCGLSFLLPEDDGTFLEKYIEYIKGRNISTDDLHGFLGFDPLTEWTVTGKKEADLFDTVKKTIESAKDAPHFRALGLNAAHFHNSGANAVQELAYTLSVAVAYLDQLTEKGLDAETIFKNIAVRTGISTSYFMQMAKLRAMRVLFFQLAQAYEVKDFAPKDLFIHAASSLWSKTAYDSNVNMLRNTTEAMSAIIGGCNSLSVAAHDAVFEQTSARGRRIARNVSVILREESYLDKVVDPSAGSYYIEQLTDSLVHHAWKLFQETEKAGGFITNFENGTVQEAIKASREKQHELIATARQAYVGTNQFPDQSEHIDPAFVRRTKEAKADIPLLRPQRATEAFDAVRFRMEEAVKNGHKRPEAFLPMMGDPAMRSARASFASNFFGCGGIISQKPEICNSIEDAVEKAAQSKAEIVVLCGSDDFYEENGEAFAQALKTKLAGKLLVLAGHPGERAEQFKAAGFDGFIHMKSNIVEELTAFQDQLLKK